MVLFEPKDFMEKLEYMQPSHWADNTWGPFSIESLFTTPLKDLSINDRIESYISQIDLGTAATYYTEAQLRKDFEAIRAEQASYTRALNVVFDFTRDVKSLATGFLIGNDKDNKPVVQYMHSDVLLPNKARATLSAMLAVIKKKEPEV